MLLYCGVQFLNYSWGVDRIQNILEKCECGRQILWGMHEETRYVQGHKSIFKPKSKGPVWGKRWKSWLKIINSMYCLGKFFAWRFQEKFGQPSVRVVGPFVQKLARQIVMYNMNMQQSTLDLSCCYFYLVVALEKLFWNVCGIPSKAFHNSVSKPASTDCLKSHIHEYRGWQSNCCLGLNSGKQTICESAKTTLKEWSSKIYF